MKHTSAKRNFASRAAAAMFRMVYLSPAAAAPALERIISAEPNFLVRFSRRDNKRSSSLAFGGAFARVYAGAVVFAQLRSRRVVTSAARRAASVASLVITASSASSAAPASTHESDAAKRPDAARLAEAWPAASSSPRAKARDPRRRTASRRRSRVARAASSSSARARSLALSTGAVWYMADHVEARVDDALRSESFGVRSSARRAARPAAASDATTTGEARPGCTLGGKQHSNIYSRDEMLSPSLDHHRALSCVQALKSCGSSSPSNGLPARASMQAIKHARLCCSLNDAPFAMWLEAPAVRDALYDPFFSGVMRCAPCDNFA